LALRRSETGENERECERTAYQGMSRTGHCHLYLVE